MENKLIVETKPSEKTVRHILALSGGKDSSALAIFMLGKVPNMEYVFCDTGEELEETYTYITKLENFLSIKINWLKSDKDFKYYLDLYNGVLPDVNTRWCTRMLKIKPYEKFIGDDPVISYVGIRADEQNRKGYISKKKNIKTVFPFVENNIRREDVFRILNDSGLGIPEYYRWRSRSGCYFCFFQQKREWIGLLENHPTLFEKSKNYEKVGDSQGGRRFTWDESESLSEMSKPERVQQIKAYYLKKDENMNCAFTKEQKLMELWKEEEMESSCTICRI